MKRWTLCLALLGAFHLLGCGAEAGGAAEDYGEASQALVFPFWSRPILAPYDYMRSDSGIRVCRNGSADYVPGQITTAGCLYVVGNTPKVAAATYEYMGTLGTYTWDRALIPNGRNGWLPNPDIPGKMVHSAGVGVCEGKPQASSWMPGRWTGTSCVINGGGGVTTVIVGQTSEYVRVLIAH